MMIQSTSRASISMTDIAHLAKQPILTPFAKVSMQFIEAISNRILLEKTSRQYPELMAMAYWLRKAHIAELNREFNQLKQDRIWLARGTVLHFAPANVDTIFMYSWVLSLLVGNNNIIRISSRSSEQVRLLLSMIKALFDSTAFKLIGEKNCIINYEHNDLLTEELSSHCDIRVIWGGDASVKQIRKLPLPVHAKEIVFANKFSMAALQATSFLGESSEQKKELIHKFYNDAFWFNQLACSSPRLIIWVGNKNSIKSAKQVFWQLLDEYCEQRHENREPAVQMSRLTQVFELAANHHLEQYDVLQLESRHYSHVTIKRIFETIREHRGGYLFLELEIEDLLDINSKLINKDQTLSVYGFEEQTLFDLISRLPYRAIDRIVPIGQALTFQSTWDGYNLFHELTRELTLQVE